MRGQRSNSTPNGLYSPRRHRVQSLLISPQLYSHAAIGLLVFLVTSYRTTGGPHLYGRELKQTISCDCGAKIYQPALKCPDAPVCSCAPSDEARVRGLRLRSSTADETDSSFEAESEAPPAEAAAAAAANAPPPADAPPPQSPDPWRTRQTCHHFSDDSEVCIYQGPVCSSGLGGALITLSDEVEGSRYRSADGRSACLDNRNHDPSDACYYSEYGKGRYWLPPPASLETARDEYFALPSIPTFDLPETWPANAFDELPVRRRWGPQVSWMSVGHMHPSFVANITSPDDVSRLGPDFKQHWDGAKTAVPASWAEYNARFGGKRDGVFIQPPSKVTWLSGNAVFSYLSHDSFSHPWHFAVQTFALWAMKRLNASVEDARAIATRYSKGGASPLYDFTVGATAQGGIFPPIDHVVIPTTYTQQWNRSVMPSWTGSALTLLTQAHTTFHLPWDLNHTMGINSNHWLCAPRGVILGQKDQVFSGTGDAHAFRLAAYAAANVSLPAWHTHPPRTITLVIRERWRQFTNVAQVVATLEATGLPVRVVTRLAHMTWAQQVALFASTGIFITGHGSALTNAMFMPARSVAIEVFPYLGVVQIYRRLAEVSRVHYYPLYSRFPSNASMETGMEGMELYRDERYQAKCVASRYSSHDASLDPVCNMVGKRSNLEVPIDGLLHVLSQALDDIGCKDSVCRKAGSMEVEDFKARAAANVAVRVDDSNVASVLGI